jgi:hypothetical protein
MRRILLGFGEFKGYQICELPHDQLEALAERFPLSVENCSGLDWEDLAVTIAIHEEVRRREAGGTPMKKVASLQELANEIVTKGFRVVSKVHHPDLSGDHDAQLRLTAARDQLLALIGNIEPTDEEQDVIFIAGPPVLQRPRASAPPGNDPVDFGITDDDVPF